MTISVKYKTRLLWVALLIISMVIIACNIEPHHLTILHHNDFHAANSPFKVITAAGDTVTIQGSAGLLGLAKAIRDTAHNSIWLYAGDDYTGTPISSMTKGSSQIQIIRRLSIDVAVLGNHEFDYGTERAEAYRDSIGIPVLGGASLLYQNGKPFALTHYDTTIAEVPIRFIGLLPTALHKLTRKEATGRLKILKPADAVRNLLPDRKCLVVVLSHLGYDDDCSLARQVPEVDVIVGGHQHIALQTPHLIGHDGRLPDSLLTGDNSKNRLPGVVIVQAGSKGHYLGVLNLAVDDGDVISASGKLLANDGSLAKSDLELARFVETLETAYTQSLNDTIGWLVEPMTCNRHDIENSMGRWVTDGYREATGAQIGFQNPGGLRRDFQAGPLKVRDIWEANPFGNTLVIFEISGAELDEVMKHLATDPLENLLASGLTVSLDMIKKNAEQLRVNGRPVARDQMYRVVTISYIMGHFESFFGVALGQRFVYNTGLIDRDVLIEKAKREKPISPPEDERITRNY